MSEKTPKTIVIRTMMLESSALVISLVSEYIPIAEKMERTGASGNRYLADVPMGRRYKNHSINMPINQIYSMEMPLLLCIAFTRPMIFGRIHTVPNAGVTRGASKKEIVLEGSMGVGFWNVPRIADSSLNSCKKVAAHSRLALSISVGML